MTVEVFKDRKKEWRFRVKASNGKVLCQSEGYKSKRNCIDDISSLTWSLSTWVPSETVVKD